MAIINGNVNSNILSGTVDDDVLNGLAGDDTLYGGNGSDVLNGGVGNDSLYGDNGNDIYQFGRGYGQDIIFNEVIYVNNSQEMNTIQLLANIAVSDVRLTRDTTDLVLSLVGTTDTLIFHQYFLSSQAYSSSYFRYYQAYQIQFADGTTWDKNSIYNKLLEHSHVGNAQNDNLMGTNNKDYLNGLAGDDILNGLAGDDTLDGDLGNDTLNGGLDVDYLYGGEGNDLLNDEGGYTNFLFGEAGNDVLNGGAGRDNLYGGEGNDDLDGAENHDWLWGGNGDDTLYGGAGHDFLFGEAGSNVLNGGTGNDHLRGGAGNDTLSGGVGNDVLEGGQGNDIYQFARGDGQDVISGYSTDPLKIDTIQLLAGIAVSDVRLTIVGASLVVSIIGTTDSLTVSGYFYSSQSNSHLIDQFHQIQFADGTIWDKATILNKVIASGTLSHQMLIGTANNDSLLGNAGNDTLDGGLGADTLEGGLGDDVYYVDNINDKVIELPNGGDLDKIFSSVSYSLSGRYVEVLTLTGVNDLSGTGNSLDNLLVGNSGKNTLYGAAGNDTLDGGSGADVLDGGLGNDIYYIDNVSDNIINETSTGGIDTIFSSVSYSLGSRYIEKLTLLGTSALFAKGNTLNNVLMGNSGNNTLSAGAGNDILDGGLGADVLDGGDGNDVYYVDNINDSIINETSTGGIDDIVSNVSYSLAGRDIENLSLTGTSALSATGNALNNVLTGNSGNNTLTGSGGNDTLEGGLGIDSLNGGLGDDVYLVDSLTDTLTELANQGIDTVQSSITFSLSAIAHVENLTLTGTDNTKATGNNLNNVLIGNSGNNTLSGGTGNDTLDGGLGVDILSGGEGNDLYYVDNVADDVVNESVTSGTDTILSSVYYSLYNRYVENLTLTGTGNVNAAGNSLNNVLTGNSGNNTLSGGTGNDTYVFGVGGGQDLITDVSGTADVLSILSGVTEEQLWFKKVGNNLEVSIIGTTDKVTVNNWYVGGTANQVEQIRTATGDVLASSQVQNLVAAMSSFSPPPVGTTTLDSGTYASVLGVIAANWS